MVALAMLMFCLWPFGAIAPILCLIAKNKTQGYYLMALWLATYSIYFIPAGDQYRFREIFIAFPAVDWELFCSQPFHYFSLVYVVMYFIKCIGLNFEIVRFVWVCIAYSIYVHLWLDVVHRLEDRGRIVSPLCFAVLIFSTTLMYIGFGFRNGMACAIASWSAYEFLVIKNNRKAFAIAVVAGLVHSQFLLLMPCYFMLNVFRLSLRHCIILSLFGIVFGELLLTVGVGDFLMNSVDEVSYLSDYVVKDGYWRGAVKETYSTFHILSDYFIKALKIVAVVVYCNASTTFWSGEDIRPINYILIIVLMASFTFVTLSDRVWMLLAPLMVLDFVLHTSQLKHFIAFKIFGACMCILFVADWASLRKQRSFSEESYFITDNILSALCHTYDQSFVNDNIDDLGHINTEGGW